MTPNSRTTSSGRPLSANISTTPTISSPTASEDPSAKSPSSNTNTSSMAPRPSIRPRSTLPPSSIIASSMLSSIIRSHRLEDGLPLGEGSLASKLFLLEEAAQRPSQSQTSETFTNSRFFPSLRASQFNGAKAKVTSTPAIPNLEENTDKPSQSKSSKPVRVSGISRPHSIHRPPSSLHGRPPNVLGAQHNLGLLKAWTASWGFFNFDRDNVFEVIDLLVQDIKHAIADQTTEFIGRAGITIEKKEILRMMKILKNMIMKKIKGHLGFG
ncbi:hypothetical protein N431DRAFT_534036 [Stipitochalara longipes BDJ]|nr:hypothetical protein N431DRAFT_534036 [Stipitochalara longipes BDJ]